MDLELILDEVDVVEQRVRALRSAIEATRPAWTVPTDPKDAAPLRARAADAAKALRGLADSLEGAGLTGRR